LLLDFGPLLVPNSEPSGSINNDWQLKWDFVTLRCDSGRCGLSIVDETKARVRFI